ncbi:ABC transporter ATP-binding protein [Thermoflexus sp.]|uniref:ABC transporter ATP-binding protein n=1 Tax=Thermoflexus sp. TaxID=1969742 RepID=UPI0035E43F8E
MNRTILEVDHLEKRFGPIRALSDVSFAVDEGEIFGIIGPDGAGKTTLLRILAGVLRPDAGSIRALGWDLLRELERVRPLLGYMPQNFSLYGDLTVRENLAFFSTMYGTFDPAWMERLLRFAHLERFLDRRAAQLSGGMQKKLALIGAMIHRPRLLLLDEPTTGVDPVSRRELWDLLSGFHLQGVTILVTTPYLDEAERCTRVALMHRGRMLAVDAPDRLRASLGHPVIEIIARPIMRVHAVLADHPGVLEAVVLGDRIRLVVRAGSLSPVDVESMVRTIPGVTVQEARWAVPRLEEVFAHLMRREGTDG